MTDNSGRHFDSAALNLISEKIIVPDYQAGMSGMMGTAVTGTGEFFKTFSVTDPKQYFPFSP
jgi:hypothetical protein